MPEGHRMPANERAMYPFVQNFLLSNKGCEKTLVEDVSFSYIKRWIIDVAGIKGARVYAVEAKPALNFDLFSAALTQARYYQQACTHVYICLPEPASQSETELLPHITKICIQEKVGLWLFTANKEIKQVEETVESRPDLDKYFDVVQQLTSEMLSDNVQGARAFILRDVCFHLDRQFHGKASKDDIVNYLFSQKGREDSYWKKQNINPRTSPDKTLGASFQCATELGLIEETGETDSFYKLTSLGHSLVTISDASKVGEPDLSNQEKAFFYALSQRYPEVRITIQILKADKRKIMFGVNKCSNGHSYWGSLREKNPHCPKCNEELTPETNGASFCLAEYSSEHITIVTNNLSFGLIVDFCQLH